MQSTTNKLILVWALALTAFILMGVTIPNTFAPNTTISSAEMNENFAALEAAVDTLESDVAGLQAALLAHKEAGSGDHDHDYVMDSGGDQRQMWGMIDADGTILSSGGGFAIVKGVVGQYNLIFDSAFPVEPAVVITATPTGVEEVSVSVTPTNATIGFRDTNGTSSNTTWVFVATGQQ